MKHYHRMLLAFSGILYLSAASYGQGYGVRHEGIAQLKGSVISSPCSIVMENQHQTINFSSLTFAKLSSKATLEQFNQPFIIELRDCGAVFKSNDTKTWQIRFVGEAVKNNSAFSLNGPSKGLGISVLDNQMLLLTPGKSYPLSQSTFLPDKSGHNIYLRYYLELALTGEPIQAGDYQGLVRFSIDYQ